jgi:MipA family protein
MTLLSKARLFTFLATCSLLIACFGAVVRAADPKMISNSEGDYAITLGVRPFFEPVFSGSRKNSLVGLPVFALTRKDAPDYFGSPHDSFSVSFFETKNFRFGSLVGFQFPRSPRGDAALRGLRKINFALEPGVFAEYFPTSFTRVRTELRQGITGHYGQILDISADAYTKFADKWQIAMGPRLSFASSTAIKPYFNVDALQSFNSGQFFNARLPEYLTHTGVRALGFGSVLRYAWTKHIDTEIFGEYERLLGSSAKAPLVRQRGSANQFVAGLGLSYKFDISSPFGN